MKLWKVVFGLLLLILVSGCLAEGHRKVTVEFLGQSIVVEDQVYKNDEGREVYRAGFDEDSSVVELLFGWLRPSVPDEDSDSVEVPGTESE